MKNTLDAGTRLSFADLVKPTSVRAERERGPRRAVTKINWAFGRAGQSEAALARSRAMDARIKAGANLIRPTSEEA